MEKLFDEFFERFHEYREAVAAEAPISLYGPVNTAKKVKEWEAKQVAHIEECKGRAIDALNDYIDKRIEKYHAN